MPDDDATTVLALPAPLDERTSALVRALQRDAAAQDGVPPLSEQPLLRLRDAEAPVVHLVAHGVAGVPAGTAEVVGYAQVDVGSTTTARAELVVHPDHRRRGVGSALLDAARARAAAVPGRRLHVWAHGDLPAARALAAAQGMPVVRELLLMGVDLDAHPPAAPTLPPGVRVRAFVPGQDEDAWRRVNARAFAHHPEQGRMTSDDLRSREAEAWFDAAGFLLAERDGVLLGSVWTKVHPAGEAPGAAPDERVGEIYVVGVDPDAQGLGLGRALTALGLTHLRDAGLRRALLYTEADNTVAVHTYGRAGFTTVSADVMHDATEAAVGAGDDAPDGAVGGASGGTSGTPHPQDTTSSPSDATMGA
ncbi:mycothiol synthase [Cellulomonas oligotrophica]|uniref:Mycothiol acetyltransferase n=1 Tax=Cellulomonas oligotrophica TaxID=931536 RepID=A0A7Y9JWH8_9CELL|nr:mycothiol synthase [Cellulomonas oligotrophica]NYD85683.1 mycothiol synthase [Cellulomonas oligotrophica]GIG31309.1 mycothiol acetyltransferase [Cellulomonas oligotrophica]